MEDLSLLNIILLIATVPFALFYLFRAARLATVAILDGIFPAKEVKLTIKKNGQTVTRVFTVKSRRDLVSAILNKEIVENTDEG